jgi:hypothetical protein
MADMTQGTRTDPRGNIVVAIILIAIGIGALALNAMPDLGGWVVLVIGLGLLVTFPFVRHYGALVPGGIMTGLGAGIVASEAMTLTDEGTGGVIVLGLGLGFLAIWVIGALSRIAEHHPWPLIPGGILAVIGTALVIGGQAVELLRFWPSVLIVLGVIVLARGIIETRKRRA